ncbi:MAG: altronate dehydratase small subunit [Thermodesulfobacteriota bacterium]|nr:altronate dehydratase small subunit [Thermodesulfobacteriota bacterium]
MKTDAIVIKEVDNVATALRDIQPGEEATVGMGETVKRVRIQGAIPYGHKFAVYDIVRGEDVLKYGEVIGRATENIPIGTHAHIQNIESLRGRGDLTSGGH